VVASFWLDSPPATRPSLTEHVDADLVIVGGGFTGLWTAIAMTDREPGMRVVVLEAQQVGHGGSGRNGGFVEASLTHGLANGVARFPDEVDELLRLGHENLSDLIAFVERHRIACHLERSGAIDVATAGWQLTDLDEDARLHARFAQPVELLDRAALREQVVSPTFLGGLARGDTAIVHPGKLARGLAGVVAGRGIALHEHTPVTALRRSGAGVRVTTPRGSVRAERAVLATNAYSHRLLRRTGRHYVPIHDYILLTAPLTPAQRSRIGWVNRQGLADSANQFHYFRLTHDDRILWGGYDAIYRYGNGIGPRHDHRRATYDLLARHFRTTFPQLGDVRFDRWWGGPIATTTRFTPAFGGALGGRVLYALGYTGLGVAATRFAARVLSDRMLTPSSPLLRLRFTTADPFPFPPEPFRWASVQMTRRAIARADRRDGRRGPWLRLLDHFGIGFDS
jgi:glycine/D-amino acid oxidase-like deaminating enzyme